MYCRLFPDRRLGEQWTRRTAAGKASVLCRHRDYAEMAQTGGSLSHCRRDLLRIVRSHPGTQAPGLWGRNRRRLVWRCRNDRDGRSVVAECAPRSWCVVAGLSWPSQSAMTALSTSDFMRCLAVVCPSVRPLRPQRDREMTYYYADQHGQRPSLIHAEYR